MREATMSEPVGRRDTLSSYRHLRLAMVFLLALLLVAVLQRALTAPNGVCFEGSISGYYFTSARAVFVGALVALGACLIVYRGNTDLEDVALNASGAFAMVVAFVPTKVPNQTAVTCSASNVPTTGQIEAAVTNNMTAFFVIAIPALAVAVWVNRRSGTASFVRRCGDAVLAVALVAGIVTAIVWPVGFRAHAHGVTAVLTFVGILAAVLFNAWGAKAAQPLSDRTAYRNAYAAIAVLMLASFAVVGGAALALPSWRHAVLVIEALLLIEFGVFWIVQTKELWNDEVRPLPPNAPTILTGTTPEVAEPLASSGPDRPDST
jgi:hypothetical protein